MNTAPPPTSPGTLSCWYTAEKNTTAPAFSPSFRLRDSVFPNPHGLTIHFYQLLYWWLGDFFFFSNFLLLFPVDLTFHAPGQVTHKPLPLSHQASKIFFSFVEVALVGDPGEERQAGRRDLEQHLARQGFSCLPHAVQH